MNTRVQKHQPSEVVEIAPESLAAANFYLQYGSAKDAADMMGVPVHVVQSHLNKREVKAYIDQVFLDTGYRNRHKLGSTLDELIDKKLEELREADVSSGKDILELLQFAHKLRMDELTAQTKLEEAKAKNEHIRSQVNVQINDNGGGTNYSNLMQELLNGPKK